MTEFKFNCTSRELAEAIAQHLNKPLAKVKPTSSANLNGDWFTFDPLKNEEEPSLCVKVENNKAICWRFGGNNQTKEGQDSYIKAVTEIALTAGLAEKITNVNPKGESPFKQLTREARATSATVFREATTTRQKIYKVGECWGNEFKVLEVYNYIKENGQLAYQVLRAVKEGESKGSFPTNIRDINKCDRILYNLDKIYQARALWDEQKQGKLEVSYISIPYKKDEILSTLKRLKQWVFWKGIGGLKKPCDVMGQGLKDWNNSDKWGTFNQLEEALIDSKQETLGQPDGLGFVFKEEDPFVFLDWDDNLTGTEQTPLRIKLPYEFEALTIDDIKGYYAEVSRSGKGIHVIIELKDPAKKKYLITRAGESTLAKKAGFECYIKNRFCACVLDQEFESNDFVLELAEQALMGNSDVEAPTVYICEGEKDADTLTKLGLLATTRFKGACSNPKDWLDQYTNSIAGFKAVVLTDRDQIGETSGEIICCRLLQSEQLESIKLVKFTPEEVPEHGDVTDYLESHSLEDLLAKIDSIEEFKQEEAEELTFEDKFKLDSLPTRKFSIDTKGNANRIEYYSNGSIKWIDSLNNSSAKVAIYNAKQGVWVMDSTQSSVAMAQTILTNKMLDELKFYRGSPIEEKSLRSWYKQSQTPRLASEALKTTYAHATMTLSCSEFNKHPSDGGKCLLNFKNGTLNLDTGEFREHRKEDYLTNLLNFEYNPQADCPIWKQTLEAIFEHDEELIEAFKVNMGYILRGDPKEKVFFIFFSDKGDTGKSTILEALKGVLGNYAGTLPYEELESKSLNSNGATHQTFLYNVKDCFLVGTSESNKKEGSFRSSLNYEKVKMLSGNDALQIRELGQAANDSIKPRFTLVMALNYKPRIDDLKDSTWNRMRIFPFEHQFRGEEADRNLSSKLIAEAEGILNWLVQGAFEYKKLGKLPVHPKMLETVNEYQREENPLIDWFEECIEVGEGFTEQRQYILKSVELWNYEEEITTNRVIQFLNSKGYKVKRREPTTKIKGLRLKPEIKERVLNNETAGNLKASNLLSDLAVNSSVVNDDDLTISYNN